MRIHHIYIIHVKHGHLFARPDKTKKKWDVNVRKHIVSNGNIILCNYNMSWIFSG